MFPIYSTIFKYKRKYKVPLNNYWYNMFKIFYKEKIDVHFLFFPAMVLDVQ